MNLLRANNVKQFKVKRYEISFINEMITKLQILLIKDLKQH
jgi:hypothetical protein